MVRRLEWKQSKLKFNKQIIATKVTLRRDDTERNGTGQIYYFIKYLFNIHIRLAPHRSHGSPSHSRPRTFLSIWLIWFSTFWPWQRRKPIIQIAIPCWRSPLLIFMCNKLPRIEIYTPFIGSHFIRTNLLMCLLPKTTWKVEQTLITLNSGAILRAVPIGEWPCDDFDVLNIELVRPGGQSPNGTDSDGSNETPHMFNLRLQFVAEHHSFIQLKAIVQIPQMGGQPFWSTER